MTPVMQSKLYTKDGIHNGNCLAACLASLLDMPLWMVPPFDDMFGRDDWRIRMNEWLAFLGYQLIRLEEHQVDKLPEYYIASGYSQRNVLHAVIYRKGELAHDPHYERSGIKSVYYTWHLEKLKKEGVETS